jgi:hypothetical protein
VASCLLEREAFAQGAELDYHAPAACPSAEEFSARVARTLQRPLAELERLGRFRVTIAADQQGYQLTVSSEVRGERGTRVLSAPDCSSVADAGALSIAMALGSATQAEDGPQRTSEASADVAPNALAPGAESTVPGADRAVPVAPASSERTPRSGSGSESAAPPRNTFALQLLGDYGALPRVSPGMRLSVGRAGKRWSGRLGVGALLPATRWVEGESGSVGGRFWLGAGRAEGCWRTAGDARNSLDACLVFEAGALPGAGVGVDVPKQSTLPWLAPGARFVGAVPLTTSRAQALLGVEGVVPLLSKRFTVERGRTELHRPARLVGRVDLGVAWQF